MLSFSPFIIKYQSTLLVSKTWMCSLTTWKTSSLGKTLVFIKICVKNKLYFWKPVLDRGCDIHQLLWISQIQTLDQVSLLELNLEPGRDCYKTKFNLRSAPALLRRLLYMLSDIAIFLFLPLIFRQRVEEREEGWRERERERKNQREGYTSTGYLPHAPNQSLSH